MEVKLVDYLARYIERNVSDDLERKMVFVGGPRQSLSRYDLAQELDKIGDIHYKSMKKSSRGRL